MTIPTIQDIKQAKERISTSIHQTPVITSTSINNELGCSLFFKCENFQKVGAFKFRGATNAIECLPPSLLKNGVATHSSGNHAAAMALAAQQRGVPAYIVMPSNAPLVKQLAVKAYGGQITWCEPSLTSREQTLAQIIEQTGASFIHPYNNFDVICGQGTAALELLEQIDIPDIVITPVGGGGLLSGTSIAVKSILPNCKVYGAEPLIANDAFLSLKTRILQPPFPTQTIADGLRTSLSELTFQIIKTNVDQILCASEQSIIKAMKLIWERLKIVVEPSSAVPLAAIMENKQLFVGKKIALILSGGNVDLENLPFKAAD